MDELYFWRKRSEIGLPHGITEHEMRQWDALEKAHGKEGLYTSSRFGKPATYLRDAPKPCIHIQALRGKNQSVMGQLGRVHGVLDPLGFPITEPAQLTGAELWMYHMVRHLTLFCTLCTHSDMAHLFWPEALKELPDSKIIDVMVYKINQKICPERIQSIPGRGYKFIPAT